jgi:phosphate-selective porin O/P
MKKLFLLTSIIAIVAVFEMPAARAEQRPVFSIISDDGVSQLSFHLALQFRWEYEYLEREPGLDHATRNEIMIRRIRPTIKGSLFFEDLTYLLHISLVPGALELMDLWFEYQFHSSYRVRVGLGKVPFTRYRLNSFQNLPLLDWSYPTHYFGAERQFGATLHNGIGNSGCFEYELGVFSGVNSRAANGIGMSKIYAEQIASPSDLADPDAAMFTKMHTEFVAHLAYNSSKMNVKVPTDFSGGPFRYSIGLSMAWDLKPTARQDMRLRLAPELELKAHGFTALAVVFLGFTDLQMDSAEYSFGAIGGVLQLSYLFFEKYELAVRYTSVHIMDDLREDARQYANAQISQASDVAQAEELVAQYAQVGQLENDHEISLGFNWYLFGTTFKWQVDSGLLIHNRIDGIRYDVRLRTQFQLAF